MRVVIAPDSFKESLTAVQAARAMERGVLDVTPDAECVLVPMADGGEGFAATVADALGAATHAVSVTGPMGDPVTATFAVDESDRRAVLDVAQAIGLTLVGSEARDVMRADTYGVGQMLLAALDHDVEEVVIGLGGSATNDGGAGLLRALGARLLDGSGNEIAPGPGGLSQLASADLTGLDERLGRARLRLGCDVVNPLLGAEGASAVFGPQKGASPEQVRQLDSILGDFVQVLDGAWRWSLLADRALHSVQPAPPRDVARAEGAGAAGGLGFALQLLGADSEPGVTLVAGLVGLVDAMRGADLVLVGEGAIDAQTLSGKTPYGILRLTAEHELPVIAFAGRIGDDADVLLDHGFAALVPIVREVTDSATALAEGAANLREAVATSLRLVMIGRRLGAHTHRRSV